MDLELLSQVHNGQLGWFGEMRKSSLGSTRPHNGIGQIRPKIWRLHFSTKREIADMSTHFFLNSEDESEAVEDF